MSADPLERRIPVAEGVELRTLAWSPDGAAAGPAFLLVHGLASNALLWRGLAEELRAAGHTAVAVDQRGHGRSDKPGGGFDFATLSRDLVAVVDAHALARPVVVGQSWGGNVVLELARHHPDAVAGAVAVDGGAIELREAFADRDAALDALRPPTLAGTPVEDIRRLIHDLHPDWPQAGIDGALANFEVRDDGTVRPWLALDDHLRILTELWDHRPSRVLGSVDVPVLLLPVDDGGDRVKRDQVARAAACLPRGEVRWFEGYDHDVHAQAPALVAEVILDWLHREVRT